MSFFELDGGAKKRAPAKKKAPAKKAKKTKKGGNFLGTVSELFAPAGWENFVTAAGLLALDRTDNYLRKNKDSKKQRGGADEDTPYEETDTDKMTGGARKRSSSRKQRGGADDKPTDEMESFTSRMKGGARKRSSSRKQRGGSDGHHTVEYLDADGSEEPDMTAQPDAMSQTGGGKKMSKSKPKSKGKARKQKGGAITPEAKESFLRTYHSEPEEAKQLIQIYDSVSLNNTLTNNNNQSTRANKIISKVIQNQQKTASESNFNNSIITQTSKGQAALNKQNASINASLIGNSSLVPTGQNIFSTGQNASFGGGKKAPKKSKAKKAPKKPKAKKTPKRK